VPVRLVRAEDYKTLKATLEFSARDQSYVVDRTFTTAKLMQGNAVLCTETTPVNKHIPALLGFGLDVFDVACAANQGDIERLGKGLTVDLDQRAIDQCRPMQRPRIGPTSRPGSQSSASRPTDTRSAGVAALRPHRGAQAAGLSVRAAG
jgi:hypothetical protein